MRKKNLEMWVGIFMLAGMGALAMLAVKVSGTSVGDGQTFKIEAHFNNIGGLSVKAPVMIGGVRVGRVGNIWIDKQEYIPVVDLYIDKQYDTLPIDTGASVLTSGLLGAQYIGLSPGSSDLYLEEGDILEFTQSAIQLESLISQFMFTQGRDKEGSSQ